MLDDIYNQRILKLAADIPRIGHLDAPDGVASAVSKLCGSKVTVEVKMDGDRVVDFAHDVKACAWSGLILHHGGACGGVHS